MNNRKERKKKKKSGDNSTRRELCSSRRTYSSAKWEIKMGMREGTVVGGSGDWRKLTSVFKKIIYLACKIKCNVIIC